LGLHVFNAVCRGYRALKRRGDKAAHQLSVRTNIHGPDSDGRVLSAGKLSHVHGADGLQPGNQDKQAEHQGEHRAADKYISDDHRFIEPVPGSSCRLEG